MNAHCVVTEKLQLNIHEDVTYPLEDLSDKLHNLLQHIEKTTPELIKETCLLESTLKFSDNQTVQQLNKQFRHKDKPTNVLSFPNEDNFQENSQGTVYIGDIILAKETIESEALEQRKDFEEHTLHLITHGLLHLIGYDHIEEHDAEEMESLEVSILGKLGIADPYK